MACERKEMMREIGADPDIYCIGCTPNPVTMRCSGITKLIEHVNTLWNYSMEGHPTIVEVS